MTFIAGLLKTETLTFTNHKNKHSVLNFGNVCFPDKFSWCNSDFELLSDSEYCLLRSLCILLLGFRLVQGQVEILVKKIAFVNCSSDEMVPTLKLEFLCF